MICYLDRAFCASLYCENKCGRKLTEEHREKAMELGLPISMGYFCNRETKEKQESNNATNK